MAQTKSNIVVVIGLVVTTLLVLALIAAVGVAFLAYRVYEDRPAPIWGVSASYHDMDFSGLEKQGGYDAFVTGEASNDVAQIFLRMPNGVVTQISQMTPANAKVLLGTDGFDTQVNGIQEFHFFVDLENGAMFREGKLVQLRINSTRSAEIGPSANGPFLTLPIRFDDLAPTFGPPVKKSRVEMRTMIRG